MKCRKCGSIYTLDHIDVCAHCYQEEATEIMERLEAAILKMRRITNNYHGELYGPAAVMKILVGIKEGHDDDALEGERHG